MKRYIAREEGSITVTARFDSSTLSKQTDKAILLVFPCDRSGCSFNPMLCRHGENKVWLPKSMINVVHVSAHHRVDIEMPTWLALDKGLDSYI